MPGLGSKAGYFLPFARALDMLVTIYGLESPGLDGHAQIPKTVEALAEYHIKRIKWVQPKGPYYLIGHFFGIAVVLEMAWHLEQAGETIALFAIFDEPTPQYSSENDHQPQTEFDYLWNIVCILEELAGIKPPFNLKALEQTESLNYACSMVMNWLKKENAHEVLFSSEGLVEELHGLIKVYQANVLASTTYQAQDKQLSCTIDLFCRVESINAWGHNLPTGWGWQQHTLAQVKIHQVTGTHVSMMKPPQVQDLADKLVKIIKYYKENKSFHIM